MSFFKEHRVKDPSLVDARNKKIELEINVVPRKGIWCKDKQWWCNKRNQFQLGITINATSSPIFQSNCPVLLYKVEVSCTDINGINKIEVLQKTSNGQRKVRPFYVSAEQKTTLVASKLQFSRSTVSKNRNLPVQDFNLFVTVSLVGPGEDEHHIATLTSEDLCVLPYGEPKPRTDIQSSTAKPNSRPQTSITNELLPTLIPVGVPMVNLNAVGGFQPFPSYNSIQIEPAQEYTVGNLSPLSSKTDTSLPSPNSLSKVQSSVFQEDGNFQRRRSNSFGDFGQIYPAAGYIPVGYLPTTQPVNLAGYNEYLSEDISNLFSNN
ncbi:hypothetical protein HDV04_004578 [Boothiomyces sp. JEL0838]|nr:hypothetical protein HDV04_004578 [Boothiomyces sp. JEL0838]